MLKITPLSAAQPESVEALLDAAFGLDRHHRTAYRLRAGTQAIPELSIAGFDGSALVGTLQCWPIQLVCDDATVEPLVMVGPVAVQPERQRSGIGIALMNHMLAVADAEGHDVLMLIGDPEYYGRLFGFTARETGQWQVPGPVEMRRLLARMNSTRLTKRSGMLAPAPAPVALTANARS